MSDAELLLVFDSKVDRSGIDGWTQHFDSTGTTATTYRLGAVDVMVAQGPATRLPAPEDLPRPAHTVRASGGFRLGRRELVPSGTKVSIGSAVIGDGDIAVFAGPCAVENREQMLSTANAVAGHGAVGLRGGAFKPRTTPYSFQGLKWAGLELLAEAREETGLPILTEVVDPRHVDRMAEVTDAFQIGTRNMQNFSLLSEVGRTGMPVVLKRGFGCSVEELLTAGEYILAEGNDQLVLCERGIRTFEGSTRFTLDLSAVALLKRRTHVPVMVDPSHSLGVPELIEPLTLAAVAAGADALLIDVHVQPQQALCDGKQALLPADFGRIMGRLDSLALGLGRRLGIGPAADYSQIHDVLTGDVV
ncbi:3-deoxy-7-phosphoheptulonate synthase [Microbispora sp. ATCC PTA-5024]|uniref:3-deoxy-7-phosphoheptulonate synthase n=1 Tax=Microbispora sp. ATCC PTA-5024 TaxID=316330 RepID=UPI0003DBC94B|nr:3-deoxy-7-phosphoheptulonate synthase [Microbispora sp. ATCC PTA-5024]ETK35460.1 phospho-2-dehydro-3-deoxyheptonate aldolase [Microbispora sp. ATCC PTA-5024]